VSNQFSPVRWPGHLTRRLFAGMLRKIAALPSPAGLRRAEASFDDDAGEKGTVSAQPFGKGASPGVARPSDAKPPLSGTLKTPWTKTG